MTATTETRRFVMHPAMLMAVIQRQAGTLTKAILEACMNSVDAGAKECYVTIDPDLVTITDDGQGFRNKAEIENWFDCFGAPHDESEHKTYGTFRMGKGQGFSFGANKWQTGNFIMAVDIKEKGLDYELSHTDDPHNGCKIEIELYEKLCPSDLIETSTSIARWVKYAPIPIYVNGKLATVDPAKEQWDFETEEAYVLLQATGSLTVYNLGMFVADFGSYQYGVSGVVVSKKQLKVNFARNDVQSDCPVWRKVKPFLKKKADVALATRKRKWTDDEKAYAALKIVAGNITYEDAQHCPVITDITGSDWTLKRFASRLRAFTNRVSAGPEGDIRGDKAMQGMSAFILSNETLQRFKVSTIEELATLLGNFSWNFQDLRTVSFQLLIEGIDENFELIESKKLTPTQRIILDVLARSNHAIIDKMGQSAYRKRRVVHIGRSKVARAWTDGATYIAINANEIFNLDVGIAFWMRMAHLLTHEYCHDENTSGSHMHSKDFYENYHDVEQADFVEYAMCAFADAIAREGKRLGKKALKPKDQLFKAEQAATRFQDKELAVAACA